MQSLLRLRVTDLQIHRYILLVITWIGISACQNNECYSNNYLALKNYPLSFTQSTLSGIQVDSTGQIVDLNKIDRLTSELEQCLNILIKRSCLYVKIPNDWFYSSCTGEELLDIPAPPNLCQEKSLDIQKCSCYWRVAIQNDNTIITPPGFKLYKAELARMVTGINDIWHSKEIVECLGE